MPQPNTGPFTFADNKAVQDIAKVPEHYRSFYEDGGDGNFTLKDSPEIQGAIKGVDTLSRTLASERAGRKADAKNIVDLTPLSEYGTTIAEITEAIGTKFTGLNEQIAAGSETKIDLEAIKKEMGANHATEIQKHEGVVDQLKAQIYGLEVTNQGNAAFVEAGGNPEDRELLMLALQPYVKSVFKDGVVQTFVVDDDGQTVRFAANEAGDMVEMSVRQKILEMKDTPRYAKLFKSEVPEGPNHQKPGIRIQPRKPGIPVKEMNSVQKISSGLSKGLHQK